MHCIPGSNTGTPFLCFHVIICGINHEWTPGPDSFALQQQYQRYNTEDKTDETEQSRSPLEAEVAVEGRCRERQEGAEYVAAKETAERAEAAYLS